MGRAKAHDKSFRRRLAVSTSLLLLVCSGLSLLLFPLFCISGRRTQITVSERERESMRFNFQEPEDTPDSRRSPTPKEPVRWVPLQSHPVFASLPSSQDEPAASQRFPRNFMAWDGDSRLYYWDSRRYLLHRLSLRLGEPEPSSVLAAIPSKVIFPISVFADQFGEKLSFSKKLNF